MRLGFLLVFTVILASASVSVQGHSRQKRTLHFFLKQFADALGYDVNARVEKPLFSARAAPPAAAPAPPAPPAAPPAPPAAPAAPAPPPAAPAPPPAAMPPAPSVKMAGMMPSGVPPPIMMSPAPGMPPVMMMMLPMPGMPPMMQPVAPKANDMPPPPPPPMMGAPPPPPSMMAAAAPPPPMAPAIPPAPPAEAEVTQTNFSLSLNWNRAPQVAAPPPPPAGGAQPPPPPPGPPAPAMAASDAPPPPPAAPDAPPPPAQEAAPAPPAPSGEAPTPPQPLNTMAIPSEGPSAAPESAPADNSVSSGPIIEGVDNSNRFGSRNAEFDSAVSNFWTNYNKNNNYYSTQLPVRNYYHRFATTTPQLQHPQTTVQYHGYQPQQRQQPDYQDYSYAEQEAPTNSENEQNAEYVQDYEGNNIAQGSYESPYVYRHNW